MRKLETCLFGACQSGALQEVEDCLEALIHPNTGKMWDPLHHAAGAGYLEIVNILLEARAEIDAKDIHGKTPLHSAALGWRNAEQVYPEIVRILLEARAHINAKDMHGETALTYAAIRGRADVEAGCYKSPMSLHRAVVGAA